jgi:hypothetical protein
MRMRRADINAPPDIRLIGDAVSAGYALFALAMVRIALLDPMRLVCRDKPGPVAALEVTYRSSVTSRARLSGFVVGAKRARTVPTRSTKNLVKFHFMLLPSNPPFCCLSQT